MTRATATLRYLRIAPRKTRAVADTIRGLPVTEAEAQLMLMPRRAAKPLLKLLRSAVANAKQTLKKESEVLFVKEIRVDQGPKLVRWMPRARGAMSPLERKMSHVSLTLGVLPSPRPSRFVVRKPTAPGSGEREGKKREKSKPEKPHGHEEGEPEKKVEKKGFAQRFFRRKAV